jgi:hypothetical protein
MSRTCSTHMEKRNACNIFVRKTEGNIPLRRCRCRQVDSIKVYLREVG